MTYLEAKAELDLRIEKYKEHLTNDPENLEKVDNAHSILLDNFFPVSETSKGVFAYPPGLMACSGIPDDAFLTEEELALDIFTVVSYYDDFNW